MKSAGLLVALGILYLLAVLAFSMPPGEIAPNGRGNEGLLRAPPPPMPTNPVPINSLFAGKGFAVGSEEHHPLWIMVEKGRFVQPSLVRELLRESKSIEEIQAEFAQDDETASYQGHMRLGEIPYWLVGINLEQKGFNASLEADVTQSLPPPEPGRVPEGESDLLGKLEEKVRSIQQFLARKVLGKNEETKKEKSEIVGHISLKTAYRDGAWVGEGQLLMNQGQYRGNYTLMLDMSGPRALTP